MHQHHLPHLPPPQTSFARTIAKTATYKLFALIAMLVIMYWRTHSIRAAISVGGIDLIVKTIIYIIHDRIWARFPPKHQSKRDNTASTPS